MSGILINNGQNHVLTCLTNYGSLWLGLMEETSNPAVDAQLGDGITEISASYNRIEIAVEEWTIDEETQIATSELKQFDVDDDWDSVNGYFISLTDDGEDAIWAEVFPEDMRGDKSVGDIIKITPKIKIQDNSE